MDSRAADAAVVVNYVVVNFNARRHLLECIESLKDQGTGQIVVVDNCSSDGSEQALVAAEPTARLVVMDRNRGYGAGVNRGMAETAGDLALVCNADVALANGALAPLVDALRSDPGLGAVGPLIHNPDGSVYPSARMFPSLADSVGHAFFGLVAPRNRFTRRYRMADWDHAVMREVQWISGACFLVRRAAFEAVGGFDESYFMYMEDVDLCQRLHQSGWRIAYEPRSSVIHSQGASTSLHPYRMILAHHRSMLRYAVRTTGGLGRLWIPLMAGGVVVRAVAACAKQALVGRNRDSPALVADRRGTESTPQAK